MIKLERLKLKNFCQHRTFEAKFQSGLIGLLGTLGAGKSNALHALRANLTDDYRMLGTKESCINWNCGKKAESYIECDWDLHGTKVQIVRSLRPKLSRLTFLGAGETIEGQTNISAVLQEFIGIHEKVLSNYVFIEQWKTFAFISKQPAERASLFSHLCGTEELATLYKLLGDQIDSDSGLVSQIDEEEHKRLIDENKSWAKKLKAIDAEIKTLSISIDDKRLKKIKKAYELMTQGHMYLSDKVDAEEAYSKAQTRLRQANKKLKILPATDKDAILRQQNVVNEMRQRRHDAKLLGQMEEPKLPRRPKKPRPSDDRVSRLQAEMSKSLAEIGNLTTKLGFIQSGNSICNQCGSKYEYTEEDKATCVEQLEQQKAGLAEIKQRLNVTSDRNLAWDMYEERKKSYRKAKRVYNSLQEAIGDDHIPTKKELEKAKVKLVVMQNEYEAWDSQQLIVSSRRREAKRLGAEYERLTKKVNECLDELETLDVGVSEDEIEAKMQEEMKKSERLSGLKKEREHIVTTLGEAMHRRKKYDDMVAKAKNVTKWIEDAEYIREILHHTALPRDIAVSRLEALTRPINRSLQRFDMDFTVRPDENLSFAVTTASGAKTTASRLSGGQTMLLALAFWMAINTVFVSDVGFLTLDEPTAGLNREAVQSLADVLGAFSRSAKKAGRQVIIVTHENALRKVFDQCVELPPS